MATSSSNNANAWTARALIFSGRPDPTWPLDEARIERFMSLWNALPATTDAMPAAPGLGYRGCIVADGADVTWHAFDGLVVHESGDRRIARRDIDRKLERAVVSSAPAGLLPANVNV
jgi:hypothetical protein